jgi:predicted TIM-barrel fold metal-dependent hydrolase
MIIDCNNNIGRRRGKPDVPVRELLRSLDRAEIDMAAAFCFPELLDNDYIFEAMHSHPDRIIGLYTVNPWEEDAAEKLRRALDRGFRGLRLEPVRHGYPINQMEIMAPILDVCSEYKIPVWVYGAAEIFCASILFRDLALQFPEVPLIIGYMGFNYEASSACNMAAKYKNIYLDSAGCMSYNMVRALTQAGPHKVLMGTGTPEVGYHELEVLKIREAVKDDEAKRLVLGGNAERLFKIQ